MKSIAAFANNKGGYIIFGVKDFPRELVGLANNNFENTEEEKITAYLNDVFSPEISYNKFVIKIRNKSVGILKIQTSVNKPVVCRKNDGELKESDIYYRYNARSERIKYPELKFLLDGVRTDEKKNWMEHFERISKIGAANAAILDVINGEVSGKSGTLVIDKNLVPKIKFINEGTFSEAGKPVLKLIGDVKPVSVITSGAGEKIIKGTNFQITDNPSAPIIRLEESDILAKYPLTYNALADNLSKRYSNFKRDKKFAELRKKLKDDKKFCLTRQLNPYNPKSAHQTFYSESIYKELDKHYTKKPTHN